MTLRTSCPHNLTTSHPHILTPHNLTNLKPNVAFFSRYVFFNTKSMLITN